ncbi:hypothetical protein Tco_1387973 [Tanacetum coccineum]
MRNFSGSGVPVGITSTCHCCSLCFQSCGNAISNQLLDGIQTSRGYGMIYNDEDGDNDAYDDDGDDDEYKLRKMVMPNHKFEDNVVEEEDGEWICFLGGNSSSGTKKYRGSNSSDGGNTGDGVKIAGGVIGSGGEIGENTGGIILSLEFSKELKEMLPDEAGK